MSIDGIQRGSNHQILVYAERLFNSVMHDVRQRYAGSILGSFWAVLYPMMLLGLYTIIYVYIFRVRPANLDEYGYVVLVLSGFITIIAFSEGLVAGGGSLISQRNLLLNTVFPAELIPLRAVLAAQLPSLAALVITIIGSGLLGRLSPWPLLLIPILWIQLLMFIAGIVWILSLISLVIRDILQALGLIAMAVMILSPAAYTPEMVPASLKLILYLNPLTYYVLSFQEVICYGHFPSFKLLVAVFLLSSFSMLLGLTFFRKVKYVFFDFA